MIERKTEQSIKQADPTEIVKAQSVTEAVHSEAETAVSVLEQKDGRQSGRDSAVVQKFPVSKKNTSAPPPQTVRDHDFKDDPRSGSDTIHYNISLAFKDASAQDPLTANSAFQQAENNLPAPPPHPTSAFCASRFTEVGTEDFSRYTASLEEKPQDYEVMQLYDETAQSDPIVRFHDETALSDPTVRLHDGTAQSAPIVQLRDGTAQSDPIVRLHDETAQSDPVVRLHDETAQSASIVQLRDETAQGLTTVQLHDETAQSNSITQLRDETAQGLSTVRLHDETAQGLSTVQLHDETAQGLSSIQLRDETAQGLPPTRQTSTTRAQTAIRGKAPDPADSIKSIRRKVIPKRKSAASSVDPVAAPQGIDPLITEKGNPASMLPYLDGILVAKELGSDILQHGEETERTEPSDLIQSSSTTIVKTHRLRKLAQRAGRGQQRGRAERAASAHARGGRSAGAAARQAETAVSIAQKQQRTLLDTARTALKEGGKAIGAAIQELAALITAAVGSAMAPLLILLGTLLAVVLLFTTLFTATVAASPYGLFFVTSQEQELDFSTALRRVSSDYLGDIYARELSDRFDFIWVNSNLYSSPQAWKEILSVYAVKVCKEGMDAVTMDEDHYAVLETVFRDYVHSSFQVESHLEMVTEEVSPAHTELVVHYFDAEGNEVEEPVEGGSVTTETVLVPAVIETHPVNRKTLFITIQRQTTETLCARYSFTDDETATVQELINAGDETWKPLSEHFPVLTVSSGGALGAVDVAAYGTVAETIYRGLRESGYSVEAACGILGNIQQECDFDPECVTGGAYGLCQWMGERLSHLKQLPNYQTTEVQTGYLIAELASSPRIWSSYGGQINHTYDGVTITTLADFATTDNVQAAAGAFCVCFERPGEFPGDRGYENRVRYAQSWLVYAQSHWPDTP